MQQRIKEIRKHLKLSQQAFGEKIGGLTRDAVNNIENGRAAVSEIVLRSIARETGASYAWLKTGEGPMMVPQDYLQKAKVDNIIDGDNEFVKQIFYGLADMPETWWVQAEEMLRNALNIKKDR